MNKPFRRIRWCASFVAATCTLAAFGCSGSDPATDSTRSSASATTSRNGIFLTVGSDESSVRVPAGSCIGVDAEYRSDNVCTVPFAATYLQVGLYDDIGRYPYYSDPQCTVNIQSVNIPAGSCRAPRVYLKTRAWTDKFASFGQKFTKYGQTGVGSANTLTVVPTPSTTAYTNLVSPASLSNGVTVAPGAVLPKLTLSVVEMPRDTYIAPVQASVPVTISILSGGGSLLGTTTRTSDALGIVTFDDLVLPTAGTYSLAATPAGAADSWGIPVTVGPAWARATCSSDPCTAASTMTVAFGGLTGKSTEAVHVVHGGVTTTVSTGARTSGTVTVPSLDPYVSYTASVWDGTTSLGTDPLSIAVHAAPATSLKQTLRAPSPAYADGFGRAVAADGTRIVVGSGSGFDQAGSAHVYTNGSGTWVREASLAPAAPTTGEDFGAAVTLSGDTAIVGAPRKNGTGAAYVFTRSGSTWTQQATLVASDATTDAFFGRAVAIYGDTALVGAPGANAAYVFTRSAGVWTQQAKLAPDVNVINFGTSVSLAQDIAAVGAPLGSDHDTGSSYFYAFARSGQTWSKDLTVASYAWPVRLSGTVLYAGSTIYEKTNGVWNGGTSLGAGGTQAGHAVAGNLLAFEEGGVLSAYARVNGTWALRDKVIDNTAPSFGAVTESMAALGGALFVGAPGDNTAPGQVFVYDTGLSTPSSVTLTNTCSRTPCTYGATLTTTFAGLPDATTTLTLATAGSPLTQSLASQTVSAASGTATFRVPTTGSLVVRAIGAAGSLLAETAPVTVPALSVEASCGPHCAATDGVIANVAGLPGNSLDWVGLYRPGDADTAPFAFRYANGQKIADIGFGTLPGGTYTFKAFANNGYTVLVTSQSFDVAQSTTATTVTAQSTAAGAATVTWAGLPGYPHDWIALAAPGSAATSFSRWTYTGGARSGSVSFTSLAGGTYVARAFANDGYTIAAESAPFAVASTNAAASVSVGCGPDCANTAHVVASYAGMPGNDLDWIGVIRAGHADSDPERWTYVHGLESGSYDFGVLPPGTYTLKAFQNNGFTVLATSAAFTVASATTAPTVTASVAGSVATVTYAGLPGYTHDWIAIAAAGSPASSFVTWSYTGGATSGTLSFTLASGTYVARSFVDNGTTIAAESAPFVVP